MATNLPTRELLEQLRALYPTSNIASGPERVIRNPWYIVVAVAYTSSNVPEAAPLVFQHTLDALRNAQVVEKTDEASRHAEQLLLARRFRDAIFKSGLLTGFPRAINALASLHQCMPEGLKDTEPMRDTSTPVADMEHRGKALFEQLYGNSASSVQSLLDEIYPDMGWFSNTIGYGFTYGGTDLLTPVETTYAIVTALIACDTPRQIVWHLNNACRIGASLEEAKAVRQIAMEVAEKSGMTWKHGVPEVEAEGVSQ